MIDIVFFLIMTLYGFEKSLLIRINAVLDISGRIWKNPFPWTGSMLGTGTSVWWLYLEDPASPSSFSLCISEFLIIPAQLAPGFMFYLPQYYHLQVIEI